MLRYYKSLSRIIFIFFWSFVVSCSDELPMGENEEEEFEAWTYKVVPDSIGKRYGVRWQIDNPYDLGERCLDAEGLRARFGVGTIPGKSDFDQVYPWSEIKRCNVKREAGRTIVVFDDDPSFSIDGSNGDVFVRIPKFYVEKYVKDGYEYRVVSGKGEKPHPAFIENGKELDAVYVSAFEGYMGKDSLLRSIANVIPTSNITAQQFLDAAQKRGLQYTLYDMRTVDMLFSLIAVEFGCRNTGSIFGHGIADYQQPIEKEWDTEMTYYAQTEKTQTNTIECKLRTVYKMTVGSNICICKGDQKNILTFAKLTNIKDNKNSTEYTFDGPPIDITKDCFIGNCAQSTNWTETCSAPHYSYMGRANIIERGLSPRERNPMRYRWIENIVGNLWHYLPDITFLDRQMYVCSNILDYKFASVKNAYQPYGNEEESNKDGETPDDATETTGIISAENAYHPYGNQFETINNDNGTPDDVRGSNYWVTKLIDDSELAGISFGTAYDKNLTSNEAFGAYFYLRDGLNIVVNGGGFDHRNRCNLLTTRAWITPSYKWHLYGARLLFKDI
ncbi:MAG: hypothetical protein IKX61_08395 [Prevotella sp.]|nr:hypothetical protein [Prevotella sp.]